MKIIITSLIAVGLLTTSVVQAERGQMPRMSPEQRVERMAEMLALDASQKANFTAIFTQHDQQVRSLHEQHGVPDRAAFHEEMRALHDSTRDSLVALLSEEQRSRFEAMPKPHGKRARGGMGQRGMEQMPAE